MRPRSPHRLGDLSPAPPEGLAGRPGAVISLLYRREGSRIDREYAVESLLAERYALFLKVYCHNRKHAASAVLDKALSIERLPRSKRVPACAAAAYQDRQLELEK